MKNLLILITIMLVGGCGKGNQTADESPKANPVKELTAEQKQKALRDSVVGEYEFKTEDGETIKYDLLDNGVLEYYENGEKSEPKGPNGKWVISKNKELQLSSEDEIHTYRINKDDSITMIKNSDSIFESEELPKEYQLTFKKIK